MRVILDASRMENREDTFVYLKEQFQLPEYFGNNLDALYDSLTDLDGETELAIVNAWALGSYAHALRRVLSDAAAENPHLHIVWM